MNEFAGKFSHYNKTLFVAAVKIQIEEISPPFIRIDCNGDGWVAQGCIEYASLNGYETWKNGAIIGDEYALRNTSKSLGVTINEIIGMTTDTSPSAVGAATIYAVWDAIEYIPTEEEISHIKEVVFSTDYDDLPNFDKR